MTYQCLSVFQFVRLIWLKVKYACITLRILTEISNFVFRKICVKIWELGTFKISINCYIKTCQSLKRRGILKNPMVFLLALKPLKAKHFLIFKTITNSNFASKLAEKSNHSFFFLYLLNHCSVLFNIWQWNVYRLWKEIKRLLSKGM